MALNSKYAPTTFFFASIFRIQFLRAPLEALAKNIQHPAEDQLQQDDDADGD